MHLDTISSSDLSRGLVNGVIAVYKEPGQTPLMVIQKLKEVYPNLKDIPLSYAGRLDPLAEGVLLILSGDTNNKRQEYLSLPKTYTVKVLFGVGTDTGDVLGLVTKVSNACVTTDLLYQAVSQCIGEYTDTYPIYSSKTVQGKPLFEWARSGRIHEINIPTYTSQIFSIQSSPVIKVNNTELQKDIESKINSVHGDFRQLEIQDSWADFLESNLDLFTADITVSCASGVYMRGLVQKIADMFGSYAIAYHIKRDKVSDISISDCIRLS